MSVAGTTQNSNKFSDVGLNYNVTEVFKALYCFANLDDLYSQYILGLLHVVPLSDNTPLTTYLRYFITQSSSKIGSASGLDQGYTVSSCPKNGDGDDNSRILFRTYAVGAHLFTWGTRAFPKTATSTRAVWWTRARAAPAFLPVHRQTNPKVHLAGQRTASAQYGYDFACMGISDLKASVSYLKGTNTHTTRTSNQSEWERDITLDYVVQFGTL